MQMHALKTFLGREGKIRRNRKFTVEDPRRVQVLEEKGLAIRVSDGETAALKNDAADKGPLSTDGGETGEGKRRSSSLRGRQRRNRRSQEESDE